MKRLVLHIGTHKTGTTSLQEFLNDNREALAQQGIHYAPSHYKYGGTSTLRNGSFLVRYAKTALNPAYGTPEWAEATARCIADLQLALEGDGTVLLTDERLWYQGAVYRESWGLIKTLLDDLGVDEVRFIVYFRRQDQFVASLWNQYVKGETRLRSTLEDYANSGDVRKAMDYREGLRVIEDAFGKGCVNVRVYERSELADGDVRVDFCDALGVDASGLIFGAAESNPSLNAGVAEVKREANRVQAYRDTDNFLGTPALNASSLSASQAKTLTPQLSARILEPYLDGNDHIARTFLQRDGRPLFAPIDKAADGADAASPGEQMRDVVHFFTATLAQEHAARLELEKRVRSLEDDVRRLKNQSRSHGGLLAKVKRRL